MNKITKPINRIENVVIDTTKISTADKNVHRKIISEPKAQEIQADTHRHKFNRDFKMEELQKAIEDTNRFLLRDDRFEFKIHERTNRLMVKLVDNETDEIIKEIPPEKILDLVASIWDLVGILVDERG
mgnify:CR=1 FL=1